MGSPYFTLEVGQEAWIQILEWNPEDPRLPSSWDDPLIEVTVVGFEEPVDQSGYVGQYSVIELVHKSRPGLVFEFITMGEVWSSYENSGLVGTVYLPNAGIDVDFWPSVSTTAKQAAANRDANRHRKPR